MSCSPFLVLFFLLYLICLTRAYLCKNTLRIHLQVLTYPALFEDQRAFTRYYLKNQDLVRVDSEGEVFHTLHQMQGEVTYDFDGFVTRPGHGFRPDSNYQRPLVLHGNAVDGKEVFQKIMVVIRAQDDKLENYSSSNELFSLEMNGGNGHLVRYQARRMMEVMAEGDGVGENGWWMFAGVAQNLMEHGWVTDALKLMFELWKSVAMVEGGEGGDLAEVALRTYAGWFVGEASSLMRALPGRSSKEAFTLVDILSTWGGGGAGGGGEMRGKGTDYEYERYSFGGLDERAKSKWTELSMNNLAIVHHCLGEEKRSLDVYRM